MFNAFPASKQSLFIASPASKRSPLQCYPYTVYLPAIPVSMGPCFHAISYSMRLQSLFPSDHCCHAISASMRSLLPYDPCNHVKESIGSRPLFDSITLCNPTLSLSAIHNITVFSLSLSLSVKQIFLRRRA